MPRRAASCQRAATSARFDIGAFSIAFDVDLDATTPAIPHTAERSPTPHDPGPELELPRDGVVMLVGPGVVRATGATAGDTVEGLAKSGRSKEIEPVLRAWLVKTIAELEAPVHS